MILASFLGESITTRSIELPKRKQRKAALLKRIFFEEASQEQLARKARVPLFSDTPLTEYPTLAAFIGGLAGWHMEFHLNHMKEIMQALGSA